MKKIYNRRWTAEDDALISKIFATKTNEEVAKILDRSVWAIKNRAYLLGLKKDYAVSGRKVWTKEEKERFIKLYPDHSASDLAKMFGVTERAIYSQASQFKLSKSEAYTEELNKKVGEALKKHGKHTRFPKGHVPANKGQKMSPELYEKNKHTFFKKGHTPANHQPVGHRRVTRDGYIMIKTAEPNVFELLHRLVWEKKHGPIPDGYIISFKDGNTTNVAIDNLECISMKENMLRNTIQNYPEELQNTLRLIGKVKRKINHHGKKENESN